MRKIAMIAAMLVAAPATAKTVNFDCVTQDGSQFYVSTTNRNVAVRWGNGQWQQAFGRIDGEVVIITQIAPNGVIVVSWDTGTNAAYVIMKNDRTGAKDETHARCWFR